MKWFTDLTASGRNRFLGFPDGRHGTEIFGPHPELPRQIAEWCVDTLVKAPADPKAPVTAAKSAASEFWSALEAPGGTARAVELYREARRRDPQAYLFPEGLLNQAAYERMQAGGTKDAIELCRLNTEAYPASANTYDSLADAYLADGQSELALQAATKAIEMLPADKGSEDFKELVRRSAQEKLQRLGPAAKPK
jgi:tetratricopeptide (TPR) repeat protein